MSPASFPPPTSPSSSSKDGILLHLLLLLSTTLWSFSATSCAASSDMTGVTYAANTPGIPPPEQVVAKLLQRKVPRVRLLDGYGDSLGTFVDTGISINLDLNSTFMKDLASDKLAAVYFLKTNVSPFYNRVNITSISVGYDILIGHPKKEWDLLLPAIKNLHSAWISLGYRPVPISTAHSAGIVTSPFPPSSAEFNKTTSRDYMIPLLQFLAASNSTFMIDLFPYDLYQDKVVEGAKMAHATFGVVQEYEALLDPATNHQYLNLFDVLVDATYSAMAKLGYEHIPVMVIGTGWPGTEDGWDTEESSLSAGEYNWRLVEHINSGEGTPMRRGVATETYVYSLYDDLRRDPTLKRDFGIWRNDSKSCVKYTLNFHSGTGRESPLSRCLCVSSAFLFLFFF